MKSKKSSIKLGEKARDSSTNQSRNDHCGKAFALTPSGKKKSGLITLHFNGKKTFLKKMRKSQCLSTCMDAAAALRPVPTRQIGSCPSD